MSSTFATAAFQIDNNASPLVYAYQAARLAVVAEVAARIGGDKVNVARPAPGLLILTAYPEEMAAILGELEAAQVFTPLVLEVADAGGPASQDEAEDYAEFLRDRSDTTVIVARPAKAGPAT